MITLRPAAERGRTLTSWLDSRHTFSFGEYFDQTHMGFRALRVINDDRVAPGAGFPTHGHADMEIVSYVLAGALAHRDSMGDGSVTVHQDMWLYATVLDGGVQVQHRLGAERCAWVQVASGTVELDGRKLSEGDGASIVSQSALSLTGLGEGAEVLVFDLA